MMLQIRRGIFETNSSSVHSLTFLSDDDYDKFLTGEYVFALCYDKVVPIDSEESEEGYITSDDDYDCYGRYDVTHERIELPDGGHANYICYYGYDG